VFLSFEDVVGGSWKCLCSLGIRVGLENVIGVLYSVVGDVGQGSENVTSAGGGNIQKETEDID